MEKIIYEPHPVTPERKAELRAQGFKILDAQFAPADHEPEAPDDHEAEAPKRGRKPKQSGERADEQES